MEGISPPPAFLCAMLATMAATTIILPTIDVPYLTTNSPPPLATHLALNICEALRCPSLCKARDIKDKVKLVHLAFAYLGGNSYQQLCAWS